MANELLLDTGALISLLDRRQLRHRQFVAFYEACNQAVVSTEAVLTEASHLLGRVDRGRQACLDFFLAGGAVLVPSTPSALRRARELIETYKDLPMDYADATLVGLAEELGTNRIFTTDRRDFSVCRISGSRAFHVVPDPP